MLLGRNKKVHLRNAMGRFINRNYSRPEYDAQSDHRAESRNGVVTPVMVLPNLDAPSGEAPDIIVGFSRNVSTEGLAILTNARIPQGNLMVAIRDSEERLMLQGTMKRSAHIGFGCFETGIELHQTVSGEEFTSLWTYIDTLEAASGG